MRFAVMIILSVAVCVVFYNQTIGIIMLNHLSDGLYGNDDAEKYLKMPDIEDTVVVIAGLVPWCIACSVPLAMLNVGIAAVPVAFYLWILPICSLFCRKKGNNKLTEV